MLAALRGLPRFGLVPVEGVEGERGPHARVQVFRNRLGPRRPGGLRAHVGDLLTMEQLVPGADGCHRRRPSASMYG